MWSERLIGLLLILAGCFGLVLIYLMNQAGWFQVTRPALPSNVRPDLIALINPLSCVLPMLTIGSIGLALLGLRKLLAPDDWQPPRHLG